MKKTILLVLMVFILATPCLAQKVEPEGIFSLDGTLWNFCWIGFKLSGFVFTPYMDCKSVGYSQDRVYWCDEGFCGEAEYTFYIDLGVFTITYTLFNGFCIIQPTIGLGVHLQIAFFPPQCGRFGCSFPAFIFEIGILNKINDNWGPPNIHFDDVWGSSGTDVFAVGFDDETQSNILLHYGGSTWSSETIETDYYLTAVWGSSGTNVFAVGDGGILHYDGSTWSTITSGTDYNLNDVWGSSGTDVFAVGCEYHTDGTILTILHYDGTSWSSMESGAPGFLNAVWGSSGTDVIAVGDHILHYDGSTWSAMTSGTTNWLYAVWGSSGTDVFAVGMNGTILHYDGNTWSTMTSGTVNDLYAVWGSSGTDVFAVGMNGTILHYDGNTWSTMTSGTDYYLTAVWGSSGTDVFAVGGYGTILHYDGSNWSRMVVPEP